jgi:hypothetical protein
MQHEKEETAFRRHFPGRKTYSRPLKAQEESTEALIKEFNRLLIKYKNNSLNLETPLALLEKENHPTFTPDTNADQQFKILNLFKKLYLETKSQDINQHLVNYLLKFHFSDKLTKKLRTTQQITNKNKNSHPAKPQRENRRHAPTASSIPKGSRVNSQASIRSNANQSKHNKPIKSSQFKN